MSPSSEKKTILVAGLGSMGKRRIRCLRSLGDFDISGYDLRSDRRSEAVERYNIRILENLESIRQMGLYAMIISVPPDVHHLYLKIAAELKIPCFVEASVLDTDYPWIISKFKENKTICAPSATLFFHPAIKKIFSSIKEVGQVTNFIYHSGQYLPDWHAYENVSDFYVSRKETGGAREIVPFELTWITKLLGFPSRVNGIARKTMDIEGAEKIDDTYNILLDYDRFIVNFIVDVVSRYAVRKLLINGTEGQLLWDWEWNEIKIYKALTGKWESVDFKVAAAEKGYNKNISEQMYIDELKNFFDAVDGKDHFFNDLDYDHKVLKLLYAAEESSAGKKNIEITW